MKGSKKRQQTENRAKGCWPVTYRFVAMGTLMAYTAFGASKVTMGSSFGGNGDKNGPNSSAGSQTLVVRRFEISEGMLGDVLASFEKITGIHVSYADEGIKLLKSEGVTGLYAPDQALRKILAESGMSYRFTATDQVLVQLSGVSTSIEVSANSIVPEVISSPKYTELLRDTPQTVSVVSQQVMQEQGVTTLRDALRNVAGISLAAGEGGAQGDNLTIRGFTARNDIFLDGMRDFGSYYRDSFNYENVDVLQGPTSVTFGRGSTGGVVNQESKVPEAQNFVSGTLQFGSDLTRRITADVNHQLGKNAAFRLNAMGQDSQVSERNIAENRRAGIAPALTFGLGTPTRLALSYLHQSEDNNPDYGIPWLFNGPAPVDRENYYGFEHGNYLKTQVDVGTVKVEHEFGTSVTLRNQARYGHYRRDVKITEAKVIPTLPDGTSVSPDTPIDEINVTRNQIAVNSLETYLGDQLDMSFRFKTGGISHTLVMGVEGGRETSAPERFTFPTSLTGTPPGTVVVPSTSLADPDETQLGAGTQFVSSVAHAIAISFGTYAVDTMKFGRRVDVIAGIRWDRFDTDFNSLAFTPMNQTNPTPTVLSQVDEKPSYRAAIVYKPTNFGSIYFDYGTSFNPSAEALSLSAANFPIGPDGKPEPLAPESNRTFEVGTKWDLPSKKLSASLAVFRTEKMNAREPSQDNPLFNVLAGTQRVDGVQVSVTGRLTDRWQVLSSYAYLNGKLVNSQAFPAAVGAQLANVPNNTFNLWTTYQLPWRLTAGAGMQFVGSRTASSTVPLDPTTGLVKQIPSYWVFNAMASRPITEHISAQINFYNLANRYYFDQPHPGHIVPGAGFTALGGLTFRF
jgi:catecholate siderophore receptor